MASMVNLPASIVATPMKNCLTWSSDAFGTFIK